MQTDERASEERKAFFVFLPASQACRCVGVDDSATNGFFQMKFQLIYLYI